MIVAFALIVVLLTCLYKWLTSTFDFWKRHNVPHLEPKLFFGNLRDRVLMKMSNHDFTLKLYEKLKQYPFAGYFEGRQPQLLIMDPELIKDIFIRDFEHFVNRSEVVFQNNNGYLEKSVFFALGAQWKKIRAFLTPTFTTSKLKAMDQLIIKCAEQMSNFLNDRNEIELNAFFERYIMDVFGSCAFGINCNSMDTESEFSMKIRPSTYMSLWTRIRTFVLLIFWPKSWQKLTKLNMFNSETLLFVEHVVHNTIEYRQRHPEEKRTDFLQSMIDLQQKETPEETLITEEIIIAQLSIFMLAGNDTSSALLTFATYQLALNPEVQAKARAVVQRALEKHENVWSYDILQDLDYIEMLLLETLRLHSPLTRLHRTCTKNYQIRGTDVCIEAGMRIIIPIIGLHYDPKYFPDPHSFQPERFQNDRSPTGFYPFGIGPRNCIGKRFALINTKLAMAWLLKDFKFVATPNTKLAIHKEMISDQLKIGEPMLVKIEKLAAVSHKK